MFFLTTSYTFCKDSADWQLRPENLQCDRFIRGGDENEIKVRPIHYFLVPSFEH